MRTGGLKLAVLLVPAALVGCGGSAVGGAGSVKPPKAQPSDERGRTTQGAQGGLTCPKADRGADVGTATFTFNGTNRISFTQDACPVIEIIVAHPKLSYRGPAGCRGQFFVGDGTNADPSGGRVDWFRYGAHDAYLIRFGDQVYHFAFAPRIVHGRLVFDHDFGDERIVVTISCPPPRPSGWLLPPSA